MKAYVRSAGRVALALLLLVGLAACVQPGSQAGPVPQEALSFNDLLGKLDSLQGPSARSLTLPGRSVFSTASGSSISLRDLSTYLNAIKQNFGSYVKSVAGGSPYFVLPMKVSAYPSTDANGQPLSLSVRTPRSTRQMILPNTVVPLPMSSRYTAMTPVRFSPCEAARSWK